MSANVLVVDIKLGWVSHEGSGDEDPDAGLAENQTQILKKDKQKNPN